MAFHYLVYTASNIVSTNHVFILLISVHSFGGLYFALLLSPTDGFHRLFVGAAFWSHGTINLLGSSQADLQLSFIF